MLPFKLNSQSFLIDSSPLKIAHGAELVTNIHNRVIPKKGALFAKEIFTWDVGGLCPEMFEMIHFHPRSFHGDMLK